MAHEKIGPRVYVYNMAFRKRFSVSEVLKEIQDLSDEEVLIENDSDRERDQGKYLDDVEPDSDGDSDGSSGNTEPYDPPEAASVHVAVADQQTASAARVWSDPGDSVPRMDFPYSFNAGLSSSSDFLDKESEEEYLDDVESCSYGGDS